MFRSIESSPRDAVAESSFPVRSDRVQVEVRALGVAGDLAQRLARP
jgi:hypothetical protein